MMLKVGDFLTDNRSHFSIVAAVDAELERFDELFPDGGVIGCPFSFVTDGILFGPIPPEKVPAKERKRLTEALQNRS